MRALPKTSMCKVCNKAFPYFIAYSCNQCDIELRKKNAESRLAKDTIVGKCMRCGRSLKGLHRNLVKCPDCSPTSGSAYQRLALRYVKAAIAAGDLPRLDGSIKCVDCGAIACHYEHRDYWLPLAVDPVCVPCNYKRGPALHHPKPVATVIGDV